MKMTEEQDKENKLCPYDNVDDACFAGCGIWNDDFKMCSIRSISKSLYKISVSLETIESILLSQTNR